MISVCTKKEFLTIQVSDLGFIKSENQTDSVSNDSNCIINDFTDWHSITIVHVPGKNPFHSSQLYVYIDGMLKRECDLKHPYLYEPFTNISLFGACVHSSNKSANDSTSTVRAAALVGGVLLNPFKNIFSITSGSGNTASKHDNKFSLATTSIPCGTQDYVWESSAPLSGQMSSCFVLHDAITDAQIKLLHSLGPNQYNINWLEVNELSDLRSKFMFYYDAKCCKDDTVYDLSMRNANAKFIGKRYRLKCLKVH